MGGQSHREVSSPSESSTYGRIARSRAEISLFVVYLDRIMHVRSQSQAPTLPPNALPDVVDPLLIVLVDHDVIAGPLTCSRRIVKETSPCRRRLAREV